MRNFFLSIKRFFFILRHFRRHLKAKSYERKIRKGILDRNQERIKLMIEAKVLIPKKTKRGLSKFIPLDVPTNAEIKALIIYEFGHKMKVLGMRISDDLKFI